MAKITEDIINTMNHDTKEVARIIVSSNLQLVHLLLQVPEDKLVIKLEELQLYISRELTKLNS